MISFLLNDKPITIEECDPNTTLQSYVRDKLGLKGTKEGCASGDCGACTLVLAEPDADSEKLRYTTVNSCITLLSSVHKKQLITPEHLETDASLHPVQQAMVEEHGSQCGFCTPGFIMSMFALYKNADTVQREEVESALSGNLCRCTGYRPIIDATLKVCNQQNKRDKFDTETSATLEALSNINDHQSLENLYQAQDSSELARLLDKHPKAKLIAGGTDLGLEITQNLRRFGTIIDISRVKELNQIQSDDQNLKIGAAISIGEFSEVLLGQFPELSELVERFASQPIRNKATLGGNIANASPIGDFPPVLLALDASLELDDGESLTSLPLAEFFTGYRQTQLGYKQWISAISIPNKHPDAKFSVYKVSKRIEDDISAVCAAFYVEEEDGVIKKVRTGFGGVAATPAGATEFEQQLLGKPLNDPQTRVSGAAILKQCFSPISDVRASAEYRNTLLANLWTRFWYEHTQTNLKIRITDHA